MLVGIHERGMRSEIEIMILEDMHKDLKSGNRVRRGSVQSLRGKGRLMNFLLEIRKTKG